MGMKKRLLSTLLALTLSACVLPLQSRAAQEEETVRIVDEIIQLPAIDTEIYSAESYALNWLTGKVLLKDGIYEKWIDRLNLDGADYAGELYEWMETDTDLWPSQFVVERSSDDSYMSNPGKELNENDKARIEDNLVSGGDTYRAVRIVEKTGSFTGDDTADDTILYNNRKDVVAHVTAIYYAFLWDHPEVFWLNDESSVLVRTEYDTDDPNNMTYTQTFYLLLFGFEGTKNRDTIIFDLREEEYHHTRENFEKYEMTGTEKLDEDTKNQLERIRDIMQQLDGQSREKQVELLNHLLTSRNAYHEEPEKAAHEAEEGISALEGQLAPKEDDTYEDPICKGYARAFKVICDSLGRYPYKEEKRIPCVLVSGMLYKEDATEPENHVWNYVQMENDQWYAVDVALSDQAEKDLDKAAYLLVGSNTRIYGRYFGVTHEETNLVSEYVPAFINGPELADERYGACKHGDVDALEETLEDNRIVVFCNICSEEVELTLLGTEGEYNGQPHPAYVDAPKGIPTALKDMQISYTDGVVEISTPVDVGTYSAAADISAVYPGQFLRVAEYSITPKLLYPSIAGSVTEMDGDAVKEHTLSIEFTETVNGVTIPAIIVGDDVSAVAEYTFSPSDQENKMQVHAQNITLSGADAENYELITDEVSAEADIVQNTPTATTYDLTTHEISVSASGLTAIPSSNAGTNAYSSYAASPIRSVLAAEDGGFVRAECVGDNVVVEWFDSSYSLLKQKIIALELPIFGGIYLGEDHNFLVCGENNPGGDSGRETMRVIRYSKDWVREAAADIRGIGTVRPFEAGSLRFARSGDYLYIRTSHQTLQEQAGLMLNVRISDMTVTDDSSRETGSDTGVFRSSFNQFPLVDGTDLLALDHIATEPRGVVLTKFAKPAGQDQFTGPVTSETLLPIAASSGDPNYTGVSLGGFAVSDTHYLAAGSSCVQKDGVDLSRATQNIFLTVTPKDRLGAGETTVTWFTDYSALSGVKVSAPHLVKTGESRFCLLWAQENQIRYCMLDGAGNQISNIFTGEASLSDCVPIVADDKLIWYVTENGTPVFHEIRLHSGSHVHYHEEWKQIREATCEEDGLRQRSCRLCSEVESEVIPAPGHSYSGDLCTRCGHDRTAGLTIHRIYGQERCETARKVAEELKKNLNVEKFDTILYTSGLNFADALAGSYLSAQKKAPILLHLEGGAFANLSYIKNNLAEGGTVYILGGENAVPKTMDTALEELGITVSRLAGDNRYRTNLKILEEGGFAGGRILVCTSLSFADSLSASATGLPILLVAPTAKELTQEQKNFLNPYIRNCDFLIVGGKNAVTEELENALKSYGTVERLAGQTRYETSVLVAAKFFEAPEEILLAYAVTFPDGLCGGVLAHARNVPLILTHPQHIAMAESYAQTCGITAASVLGGPGLIGNETVENILS